MASFIYLASSSPRRRELLEQIGVRFEVVSANVEEEKQRSESPMEYVQRLAMEKARAGLVEVNRQGRNFAPVLGADTLGLLDGKVLEKPKNEQDAIAMLQSMSGRSHQVITALTITDGQQVKSSFSVTEVCFRTISLDEIHQYWQTTEPWDKAGAYAIQGLGAVFVSSIRGSYSNVVGLPIETCCELLKQFDIPWWSKHE